MINRGDCRDVIQNARVSTHKMEPEVKDENGKTVKEMLVTDVELHDVSFYGYPKGIWMPELKTPALA